MSLKPDDLAQIILDSIDDDEPPTALYTLNIHEARMLAHAVLDLTAKVKRVEALAEGLEHEADKLGDSRSGLAVHSGSVKGRVAARIRTALNGGNA